MTPLEKYIVWLVCIYIVLQICGLDIFSVSEGRLRAMSGCCEVRAEVQWVLIISLAKIRFIGFCVYLISLMRVLSSVLSIFV